jgi:hypothetical protein
MSNRFSRLISLWRSRHQSLDQLASLETLDETLNWARHGLLLGFNRSALRFRLLYSLAKSFHATEFIETGTYHAATAICAHNAFRIPVRTCEASFEKSLLAKFVTLGLSDIYLFRARTERWLPGEVERQRHLTNGRPFFYLDAHPAGDVESWPLRDELRPILKLDSFLVVIDDFSIPEQPVAEHGGWAGQLVPAAIEDVLTANGVDEIYFPAYPPELESGYGRTGFTVLFRSAELGAAIQRGQFPLNLLKAHSLNGSR